MSEPTGTEVHAPQVKVGRPLTAATIKRLGKFAPKYTHAVDGKLSDGCWLWDETDAEWQAKIQRLFDKGERMAAAGNLAAAERFFAHGDRELQAWGKARRSYEMTLGIRKSRGGGAMSLGHLQGMKDLRRAMKDAPAHIQAGWKAETGELIERTVVPKGKRYAPIRDTRKGADFDWVAGRRTMGPSTTLTTPQHSAKLAYVYPDDRAAPGTGKPKPAPGSLRASVKKQITTTRVGVKVGGGVKVPYAGPIVWGWELRNIRPQNFIWAAVMETREEVVDELAELAGRNAERLGVQLGQYRVRSTAEWAAARG